MKLLAALFLICLISCTYAPKYVVVQDSNNTYAPSYSRTTTNEWSKDLKAVQSDFNRSPKRKAKITRYIYGVKK